MKRSRSIFKLIKWKNPFVIVGAAICCLLAGFGSYYMATVDAMNASLDSSWIWFLGATIAFIALEMYFGHGDEPDRNKWKSVPMPLTNMNFNPVQVVTGSMRVLVFAVLLACSCLGYAADFSVEDMQGKTHRLSDYRGKWVLVNFWATWCPPCLREIPELISLHNAHQKKDLVVIGIAMDSGTSKVVTDFAKLHGISYPVVKGDRKITAQIGAVDVLPVSYLYNPKGEQVSYQAGEVTRASVEAYIANPK